MVNHILESSPAAAAGLKLGDAIAELDGTPVVTGRQIFKLNTKSAGEVVPMSVRRIGETSSRRVELTLGSRPPTYFEARVVDRVGIISCESFPSASAGDPLAPWLDALSKFDEAKVAGLVFDLRWNRGGGGIPRLASLFVPAETLWYSSRAGKITPIRREGSTREVQSPIVVVVDEETGSGAEYLAFCLQQHRRAKIVGQPTAGALTGVTTLPVAGGILRFPVSVICDEHGASPAGFRVAPDVVVPNRSREDLSTRGDPQLEKAIQLIHATKPADRTGRVETGNGISLECPDSADTRLGMAEKGSGRGS